jgi:hypothetical protein
MNTLRTILIASLSLVTVAFSANAQTADAPSVSISQIAICTDVQDRVPVGEAESYPNDVGYLFCFTAVENAPSPTQLFHRWYVGDELVTEIPINVKGESWRCWSRKTIQEKWSGPCRVEVLTEAGDLLKTVSFTLVSPS